MLDVCDRLMVWIWCSWKVGIIPLLLWLRATICVNSCQSPSWDRTGSVNSAVLYDPGSQRNVLLSSLDIKKKIGANVDSLCNHIKHMKLTNDIDSVQKFLSGMGPEVCVNVIHRLRVNKREIVNNRTKCYFGQHHEGWTIAKCSQCSKREVVQSGGSFVTSIKRNLNQAAGLSMTNQPEVLAKVFVGPGSILLKDSTVKDYRGSVRVKDGQKEALKMILRVL